MLLSDLPCILFITDLYVYILIYVKLFYFFQKIHKNTYFCTAMTSFGVITFNSMHFPLRLNHCHSKLYHELQYFVSVAVFQCFLYHSFSMFKRCSVCADGKPSNSKNYSQLFNQLTTKSFQCHEFCQNFQCNAELFLLSFDGLFDASLDSLPTHNKMIR